MTIKSETNTKFIITFELQEEHISFIVNGKIMNDELAVTACIKYLEELDLPAPVEEVWENECSNVTFCDLQNMETIELSAEVVKFLSLHSLPLTD